MANIECVLHKFFTYHSFSFNALFLSPVVFKKRIILFSDALGKLFGITILALYT